MQSLPTPPVDYVIQYANTIEQLLREAGGGNIDRDIKSIFDKIESVHKNFNDTTQVRNWRNHRIDMVFAGQRLERKTEKQENEIRKAKEHIRKYQGTSRQVSALEKVLSQLASARRDLGRSLTALQYTEKPSAGFNHRELDPAIVSGQVFTHYHHGPDGVQPATFALTGPAGSEAKIKMEHEIGMKGWEYGGHRHRIDAVHLGTFSNNTGDRFQATADGLVSFRIPRNGIARVQYLPSDVCTRRKFTITLNWNGGGMQWMIFVDIRYFQVLYDLNDYDLPYMHLYTGDENHPTDISHYGSMDMINALRKLDQTYGLAYEAGEFTETVEQNRQSVEREPTQPLLLINDISLPWGGLFKIRGNMAAHGHGTHKWGNDVDVRWRGMSVTQREWFRENAARFFARVEVHSQNDPNNIHWHLDVIDD